MRRLSLLLVILLLAISVTASFAQEKKVVKEKSCTLEPLDGETKIKLEKLKLQHKLDVVDLKAEREKIHGEMMDELLKDEPSAKTLEKLGKSMNSLQLKMHQAKIGYLLAVKKIMPADHWKPFLHGQFAPMGCGPEGAGCKGKGCCVHGDNCKAGKGCCLHGEKGMGGHGSGAKGHACTPSCSHAGGKAGCEMKCIKTEK